MNITINNSSIELPDGSSLSKALESASITPTGIAIAVNDTVVPKSEYETFELHEGDNIIIIKAFYGG